jgi:type II secretory pathway component PulK
MVSALMWLALMAPCASAATNEQMTTWLVEKKSNPFLFGQRIMDQQIKIQALRLRLKQHQQKSLPDKQLLERELHQAILRLHSLYEVINSASIYE